MIRFALPFLLSVACTSPQSAAIPSVDLPCSQVHCTVVDCTDDPAEQCTCYWPPANPVMCWGEDRELDRAQACLDQADMWCAGAGMPTPGCSRWYVARCDPPGDSPMYSDEQAACLAAILTSQTPRYEPRECISTWR